MNTPRFVRVRVTATSDGTVTDCTVQEVQQVVRFVDGYPCPPEWKMVRDLTEDEMKALNISFAQKVEDEI